MFPTYVAGSATFTGKGFVPMGPIYVWSPNVLTRANDERLATEGQAHAVTTAWDDAGRPTGPVGGWYRGGVWSGAFALAYDESRYGAWLVGEGDFEGQTAFIHGTMESPEWWAEDTTTATFEAWIFSAPTSIDSDEMENFIQFYLPLVLDASEPAH